jgi:hypothetical protein
MSGRRADLTLAVGLCFAENASLTMARHDAVSGKAQGSYRLKLLVWVTERG